MAETFKIGSPRSLTPAGKAFQSWRHRSWLILPLAEPVPKLAAQADWIVVDLTEPGSVLLQAPAILEHRLASGSQKLAALLPCHGEPHAQAAVALARRLRSSAVVLSAADGGADVQRLEVLLRVEEARSGDNAETAIIAMMSEAGLLAAASFQRSSSRLVAIGLRPAPPALDRQSIVARFARAQLILAARAAGVLAIDAASAAGDVDALGDECLEAFKNGFSGKLSCRPDQVETINDVFLDTIQPEGRTSSNTSEPPSA
jgi:citrate lyase beta subunit